MELSKDKNRGYYVVNGFKSGCIVKTKKKRVKRNNRDRRNRVEIYDLSNQNFIEEKR